MSQYGIEWNEKRLVYGFELKIEDKERTKETTIYQYKFSIPIIVNPKDTLIFEFDDKKEE